MPSKGWEKTKAFSDSDGKIDHQSTKQLNCLTPEQLQYFNMFVSFYICFGETRSQERTNRFVCLTQEERAEHLPKNFLFMFLKIISFSVGSFFTYN